MNHMRHLLGVVPTRLVTGTNNPGMIAGSTASTAEGCRTDGGSETRVMVPVGAIGFIDGVDCEGDGEECEERDDTPYLGS
jgi:hypothetical protein